MNDNRMKFFVERDRMFGDTFAVRMGRPLLGGGWAVAGEVGFIALKPDEVNCVEVAPCFRMHREDAQALMDELWHCGLRPTEGTGSAGAMAATERHLKDLQRLVFKDKPAAPRYH